MQPDDDPPIAAELSIALAYTPAFLRERLGTFFALDQRLARINGSTTEPMLAQMKLAWWRDMLAKPRSERPVGDQVLDAIADHWPKEETALIGVVDGWEHLLSEPPLSANDANGFAAGRTSALATIYNSVVDQEASRSIIAAAHQWALADLASKVSLDDERAHIVELALSNVGDYGGKSRKLPKAARGIAVLSALARRALERGGRPLMEGRGAALTAARAGLIGM